MKRDELKKYVGDEHPEKNYGYSNEVLTEQEGTKFAIFQAMGIEKLAEELIPPETGGGLEKKPVQFKDLKKKPPEPGLIEPEVIPESSGKVSEAITKFNKTQQEIDEAKKQLAEKIKPLQDNLKEVSAPWDEDIKSKTALLNSYMNMIFDQLLVTDKQIAAYEKFIFAAYQKVKLTVPNVSLAQVIAKAETIDLKLADEIKRIKILVENVNTNEVLEQTLYKYPMSKVQEKKVGSLKVLADLSALVKDFVDCTRSLEAINSELRDLVSEIE
jgi:hypothetical protein